MFDPILEQYLEQLDTAGKSPATRRAVRSHPVLHLVGANSSAFL